MRASGTRQRGYFYASESGGEIILTDIDPEPCDASPLRCSVIAAPVQSKRQCWLSGYSYLTYFLTTPIAHFIPSEIVSMQHTHAAAWIQSAEA